MPLTEKRKEYQRNYQRQWIRQRRREFFQGKCCALCGSIRNLELDHVDPATKVSHLIWSWSKKRREEELKKCQILCRPCHKKKTRLENQKPTVHGTRTAYMYRGCRCEKCMEAASKYRNEQRYIAGTRKRPCLLRPSPAEDPGLYPGNVRSNRTAGSKC